MWDFAITDIEKYSKNTPYLYDSIHVTYDSRNKKFTLHARIGKDKKEIIIIDNSKIEFYFLLKIATSFDYHEELEEAIIDLLEFIKHPIPREIIKISTDSEY
ncbi:MAG: hypothetical protein L3J20_12595 [Flavobacteriaceae bacterium]|nr:hypothetical protein [Flavobacteriaceae bacterium]